MSDGRLTRLEVLRGLEPVDASARLTMSASSAAPVSSAETPVKTTMKTVTEPIVETVNKAGVAPATTRAKPIRLHQVWRPAAAHEPDADELDRDRDTQVTGSSTPWRVQPEATARADQGGAPTRIALRPHDPSTGEAIDKSQVVRGYEYDRGQFVTFTAEELKALDVESSKVIDLETFVPRGDIDPVYVDTLYYLYPDGPIAVEALRVIGAAMAEACVVGIGRLALSRRERIV